MSKRKRKGRKYEGPKARQMDQRHAFPGEGEASYEELLDHFGPAWGPVGSGLDENHKRRRWHLANLSPDHDTLIRAVGQLVAQIQWLADFEGLPEELSYLLYSATWAATDGVESLISGPDPHPLDESRYLMEVESLLRLFARNPEELAKWSTIERHMRNQTYGFGRLMEREGRAQGVPEGHVLPERNEYATHSHAVHPAPFGSQLAPAPDPLSGLFNDLGDLVQHIQRVWMKALDAAEAFEDQLAETSAAPLPEGSDIPRAGYLIQQFNLLSYGARVPLPKQPHIPRKSDHPTDGAIGAVRRRQALWGDPDDLGGSGVVGGGPPEAAPGD